MSRSRNYCITINNYTADSIEMLAQLECRYVVYGKEVGDQGTPHLQGYVSFNSLKSIAQVIKSIPGAHVTVAAGTADQNYAYCTKDGDFTERGDRPMSDATKGAVGGAAILDKWDTSRNLAKEGRFDEIDSELFIKYQGSFNKIHASENLKRKLPDTETEHLWYYGPPGTGKSRMAREMNPDLYLKMCNKWWDGYTDQDCVLLEDFDKNHACLLHHLKIWGDRYPFPGEKKGTCLVIRPNQIIVTSNYHPRDIWPGETEVDPILRRFKVVHFPGASVPKYAAVFNHV